MELDYRNMTDLISIRQKQIEDVALERDYFNTEYVALQEIKNQLAKILILERDQNAMYYAPKCVDSTKTQETQEGIKWKA